MIDWSVAWEGTKLIDRIDWARENLEPIHTEYCVVYDDLNNDCASIMYPDPHCMAMLVHGNLMPPAWVKYKLRQDSYSPDFIDHKSLGNDKLLHDTKPIGPLTEEQAVEYIIVTDVPSEVWMNWDKGNRQRMVICRKDQLPASREFRDAWSVDAPAKDPLSVEHKNSVPVFEFMTQREKVYA
jgi:hypothetical protein